MTTTPNSNTRYIGIYTDSNETASTSPGDYDWTRYVGEDVSSQYLTEITNNGLFVHRTGTGYSSDPTATGAYGVWVNDYINIINNGINVAQFGSTARIGGTSGPHLLLDSESLKFKYGSTTAGHIRWYGDSYSMFSPNSIYTDDDDDDFIIGGRLSFNGVDGTTIYMNSNYTVDGSHVVQSTKSVSSSLVISPISEGFHYYDTTTQLTTSKNGATAGLSLGFDSANTPIFSLYGSLAYHNPSEVFYVTNETVTVASSDITSAGNGSKTKSVSNSGYYPVGVIGYYLETGGSYSRGVYLSNISSGSCTINVRVYATAQEAKTFHVYILWAKVVS